ncbi:hypothetical protein [Rhodopseudomonas sp. B29]|uniref:hypothetical protein n=1 Tax=Rhodopseudomonas sp. B29 TaxID=95607 RepID=UPI000346B3A5|nr:hypothetical protein [Rhodopseudomonas sp. B29]
MIIRQLIAPAIAVVCAVYSVQASAQSAFPAPLPSQMQAPSQPDPAFPAPLPNQSSAPAQSQSVFPPVNGGSFPAGGAAPIAGAGGGAFGAPPQAAPMGQQAGNDACMQDFLKLRQEAEKRGKAIQAAGKRKAPPSEACKLIGQFSVAETNMIKYVVTNAKKCGIPTEIADQLRKGHKNTEGMQQKVCAIAEQQQRSPAGPSLADVLGSSSAPEANTSAKKYGGTTFDTLSGNVLQR